MNSKSDKSILDDGSSKAQSTSSAEGFANSSINHKLMPTFQQAHEYSWQVLNFSIVALATSAAIVVVQSPVKTVLVNLAKNGALIPPYNGGVLGFMRALYAGTAASLSGSAVRTAYVTGAKNSKPIEEGMSKEEGKSQKLSSAKLGYVLSMAFGDILVTQIPESLSQLRKVPGLLPDNFKWKNPHNTSRLMFGGFTPRYCAGIVNFTSLCVLEERFVKMMPFQDMQAAHFTAGALSGVSAAFFSYPFTSFKDHLMVKAKVTDGFLYNANAFTEIKNLSYSFAQAPMDSLRAIGSNAIKQLPLRMGLTGGIFSLVSGIGSALGSEPLKNIVPVKYQPLSITDTQQGFFNPSKIKAAAVLENKPSDNQPSESGASRPQ
ncbi:hypothetical protein [uncultured Legionella sp.]|uniref:hypothetical protein n=1 Tax=uncultured Legionella sp. TaxID=210934 RepID=UPI00261266CD|nr:hypothetical protein [uncultured Legionella sp.]